MKINRKQRAKLNISTTLMRQLLTTICGVLIPRAMIGAYGSTVYGATTSIAQFLSYISLLEGGIGRVARGALYEPLAKQDYQKISKVYQTIKDFFRKVGFSFIAYTIILAVLYYDIADITVFSREYTFALVVAISLSTVADYMGGIGNLTLLHADQKQYLTNTVITITNIINCLLVVCLVSIDSDVLTVKLVSSCVFVARPVIYSVYVKKNYTLTNEGKDSSALEQRWTGIGQHIAYFIHTNTDVILLTLFADLKMVAVYSVYHMIVSSIWNIASSFSGGMEAAFGELIAKKKEGELSNAYGYYKFILIIASLLLFGCTAVLIIPFVKLYTEGVTDADYVQPMFAFLLIMSEAMNCFALPCYTLPISANSLKQSRMGSYCEAIINIVVSLVLIRWNPLIGVALGTFLATLFKCVYYMIYSAKHILKCGAWGVIGKFFASIAVLLVISVLGILLFGSVQINSYIAWFLWGVVVFFIVGLIVLAFGRIVFPQEMMGMFESFRYKLKNTFRKA